jgi:enoyl-CoA hydratase/carnithine racemase
MTPHAVDAYEHITIDREPELTWITLNRPDKLNAMHPPMLGELRRALDELKEDPSTRVIAIRGAGRAFCAGYDLSHRDETRPELDIVEDYDRLVHNIESYLQIWDHPKPVIAAVHGYCLAGATQLCVACDITVVAEDAVIGLPEIPVGGGYITPMWVPLVGVKRAKQMSFLAGSKISGETASQWGWANYAVPATELEDNVRELAKGIGRTPGPILHMKKVALNRVADVMGFRTTALMGAETDALLHYSGAVQEMRSDIRNDGLKAAIEKFKS